MGDKKITILDIIADETVGKRFNSHKYVNEEQLFMYEKEQEIEWKESGETNPSKVPVFLGDRASKIKEMHNTSIFSYFLDGSRKTYKIDDMSYKNNIFPIVAGQVAVGCLKRINKEMKKEDFVFKNVISLPFEAKVSNMNIFKNDMLKAIKERKVTNKFNVQIDDILVYKTNSDDNFENQAIVEIQDFMIKEEQDMVASLVKKNKLNQDNWLIKDGSLEYIDNKKTNTKVTEIKNNYKYVIGVSKSFNPTKCIVKSGKSNSDFIANLKLYERTPAYMYKCSRAENVHMVIWYVRIRDKKHTANVFDGILKVEKILLNELEIDNGLDTDMINHITSHLINERNPVCYGKDSRWANHLYPIYLTESYIKSKYISNSLYLQMF